MASFEKRSNGRIRAHVFLDGIRESPTFPSMGAAKAWAAQREAEILGGVRGGAVPSKTFGDLMSRYAETVSVKKMGARWETVRITSLQADPLAQVRLKDLTGRQVSAWRDRRLAAVSGSTVGREWNLYSAACSKAVNEWHWLRTNPFAKEAGVQRPKVSKARRRIASDVEMILIAAAAQSPLERVVVQAAYFGIETAMRAGEILSLDETTVDTTRRVARLVDTWQDREKNGGKFTSIKTGADREVPLSAEAIRIWDEAGGKGFKVSSRTRDTYWRALCKAAGVEDLHFHDLRHTAITRLVNVKKLDVLPLARMTGHANINELMTYYNESAEDIARRL